MAKARNNQPSSCPEGWLKDGIKLPVHLTVRQEQYAARAVGIARSVFNLMVATHRSARCAGPRALAQSPGAGEAVQRTEA